MVNVRVQHYDLYKLPNNNLTNASILSGSVQFGSGRNKLVQLLIWSRSNGGQTMRSLTLVRTRNNAV